MAFAETRDSVAQATFFFDDKAASVYQKTHDVESKIEVLLSCMSFSQSLKDVFHVPRLRLRIAIVAAWSIGPGQRILDIGCGQGESTIVLASELGPSTHVTGLDRGSPEYGTPFTIAESQASIKRSVLGRRVAFVNSDAPSLLAQQSYRSAFDVAVLCHSLCYFPSLDSISVLFNSLAKAGISRIYVAEYCSQPSHPAQAPHILAAQAQALLSSLENNGDNGGLSIDELNVRVSLTVATILEAAQNASYVVSRQGILKPEMDYQEGHLECVVVLGKRFRKRVTEGLLSKAQQEEVLSYIPRVKQGLDELEARGIKKAPSMDVWWATLEMR